MREEECKLLIDDICQDNFSKNIFGLRAITQIDKKFVMVGHSFGGSTALMVGDSDPRVKAVLVMDPWLMPIKK